MNNTQAKNNSKLGVGTSLDRTDVSFVEDASSSIVDLPLNKKEKIP